MYKIKTVIMIILSVFLLTNCGEKSKNIRDKSTETEQENNESKKVFPVKVDSIKKERVARKIEYTANLTAFEEIHYAPASPGRIEKINVEVGDRVHKGDLLVQMDRTQLMQAEEQFQNARSNFQRMDTLYRLKSMSEQQYEVAKTQYEVAKANVEFLRDNTTLISPINGIVTGKYYQNGEMFSGVPNTKAGKAAVVTLMQINPLKAFINVSERYYPDVKKGMIAGLKADIFKDQSFKGTVNRVDPVIDPDTRTFQVEYMINNPKEILRPGMFARVNLDLGETMSLVAPINAIMMQEGTDNRYIFTLYNDTVARKVNIKIGDRFEGNIQIFSETIRENDPIIIAGQEKLIDSSLVKIVH